MKTQAERFGEVERMTVAALQQEDFAKYERLDLEELTEEFFAHVNAANRAAFASIYHARRVGEILLVVKKRLKHGQFGKWMEENWDKDPATLQLYMRIAKHWEFMLAKAARVPDFPPSIREAKLALRRAGWTPDVPIDVDEFPRSDRAKARVARSRRAERDVAGLLASRRGLTAEQVLAAVAKALGLRRPRGRSPR
jgi:hypothetical protein